MDVESKQRRQMMAAIFEEYEFPRSPGDQMDPAGPVTDGVRHRERISFALVPGKLGLTLFKNQRE